MNRPLAATLALSLPLLAACGADTGASTPVPGQTYDFSGTLRGTVDQVIVPTYASLRDRAAALHDAVKTLAGAPNDAALEAARTAWRKAREPWEQSEAFLFGPVADNGFDPSLDSWPVDRVQLDQVLASGLTLSEEALVSNFAGGLRGFHTIEYLLWGPTRAKTAAQLTARELQYLEAATAALATDAEGLHDAWADEGGYGDRFAAAGQSGSVFQRPTDAVEQLLRGMIDICDEVANGKIADPFKARDRQLEESQFSDNSTPDFADNLRSARNIYTGALGTPSPQSLSAFVRTFNAELDTRLTAQLDAAVTAILNISADGETFGSALTNPAKFQAIEAAQAAVRDVMTTLQREVRPLITG